MPLGLVVARHPERVAREAGALRDTGIGRGSVYKWMRLGELPPRRQMDPRHGMPAFYRAYLMERWAAGQQSGRLLLAEIKSRGYVGGYSGLARLLAVLSARTL